MDSSPSVSTPATGAPVAGAPPTPAPATPTRSRRRRDQGTGAPPVPPAAPVHLPTPAPAAVTPERVAAAFGGTIVSGPGAAPPAPPAAPRVHVPTVPVSAVEGLEEITRNDLVIPRFSINQPTSKEGEHPGHFRDNMSEVELPELKNVIALKVRKGRVFFRSAESTDADCASDDMIVPADRIEHPISKECAGCPQAKWSDDRNFKRCHETYSFLILHDGLPYFITFKSAAIKYVKKLLTQLALRAAKEKKAAWAYRFDISLQIEVFDAGKAYMPRFERLAPITDQADLDLAKQLFAQFGNIRPTFDQSDAAPTAAPAGAGGGGGDDDGKPFIRQF